MTLSNSQSSSGNNNNNVLIHRTSSNSRTGGNTSGSARRNNCDRGQNSKGISSQYYNKTTSEFERSARSTTMPIASSACKNYSNTDMSSIEDPLADSDGKFRDSYMDERLSKPFPETVESSKHLHESASITRRYTRSALYLIRNEARSRCRPKCASKLQLLCIWKANNNYLGSSQQNGGNNNSSSNQSNSVDSSSLSSPRINSITRQQSNQDHLYSGNSGGGSSSHNTSQKSYLDQRSISSSHLMPAFAKRRIGNFIHAICGNSSTGGGGAGGGVGVIGGSTSTDSTKFANISGKSSENKQFSSPQRKNNSNTTSKSVQNSTNTVTDIEREYEREKDHDRERGRERDVNLNSSTGSSSNARERRIGSGRLLPRDVNWDYHSEKESKESASTSSVTMPFEKDMSSHLSSTREIQRVGSGNQNSRFDYSHRSPVTKDRNGSASIGGKNSADYRSDLRYENRRPFARGDYERDNRGDNSNYVRRFMSDLINQNTNNFSGKSGSGMSGGGVINHNENRRRNIRNDEPEWFSSGPTSQHDTIELRGFDEIDDSQSNSSGSVRGEGKSNRGSAGKQSNRRCRESDSQVKDHAYVTENENSDSIKIHDKNNTVDDEKLSSLTLTSRQTPPLEVAATDLISDTNNNSKDKSIVSEEMKSDDKVFQSRARIKNDNLMKNDTELDSCKDLTVGVSFVTDQGEDKTTQFNFDAFLNVDPSNLLICEQTSGDSEVGSRFSRWFGKQNENQKNGSNEVHEISQQPMTEDNMVPLMLESQMVKNERESCESTNNNQSNTLMEFLQRGKINTAAGNMEPLANVGSIPSVEELEARMRKIGDDDSSISRDQSTSNGNENMSNPLNQFLNNSILHQQHQQRQKHIQQLMMKPDSQSAPVQNSLPQQPQQPQHLQINPGLHSTHLGTSQTQDMEAFKKLLEQITPNTSISSVNLTNQNIQQLVPPSQQQQIQRLPPIPSQQVNILTTIATMPSSNQPQLIKNDELTKFIQQQHLHQRRSQHVVPGPPQHQQINHALPNEIPIIQTMFLAPQQRLEAQLLLQGISRGEVSQTTLGHQLSNPNTSPRTKEVLAAVLRETSRDTSPNVIMPGQQILSPVLGQSHCAPNIPQPPPPIIIPSPQPIPFNHPPQGVPQQQHPSTGTNAGLPQRIPSPRELQYHTQSIMQNALIKKKLEEQQENFRRRQEIQKQQMQQHKQQQSPSHVEMNEFNPLVGSTQQQQYAAGQQHQKKGSQQQQQQMMPNQQPRHVNSPTPLAFTPTSVLRKMTAEKESVNSFSNSSSAATATTTSTSGTANTTPLVATTTNVASNAGANNPNPNKPMHPLLLHYQQQHQTTSQNQPRMILGIGSHSQQQQQQGVTILSGPQIQPQQQHPDRLNPALRSNPIKWTGTIMNQVSLSKPMGRPILKGNITQSMPPPASGLNPLHQSQQSQPQPPQMTFASKIEFQQIQQQRGSNNQQPSTHPQQKSQAPPQQQQAQSQQQQSMPPSQQQSQNMLMTQLYQQRAAIQRAQHFQFHQIHQQQQHQQQQQLQQQHINIIQNTGNRTDQRINTNHTVSNCGNIINYQRDGGLSPTSNQLARWFSPELLAQASEGKLPPLNMNQVLSLEEFEKSIQHSSAAVNN